MPPLAVRESLTYPRCLLGLCELELEERCRRRVVKLLRDSKLPREKTLENLDRTRLPQTA